MDTFDRQTSSPSSGGGAFGTSAPLSIDVKFIEPIRRVFLERWRYKVLWGGRGAGRSWGIAMALLCLGTQRPIRVLCVRELQNSIAESVHAVLKAMIGKLHLESFYEVQINKIIGHFPDGRRTEFFFEGIKNNVNKIKSYEGVEYCWVEEANKVSQNSWMILIPTIRKEVCPNDHPLPEEWLEKECPVCGTEILQSEIWMSFNPELESDYTYDRFVKHPNKKNTLVVKMNWRDNPYFPRTLREEMEDLKARDYESYLNVWEGHCLQQLKGAIFAKQLAAAQKQGRITNVPWDHETPVDTFWDLGRRDMTSIWFAQRVSMQWRILEYFEDSQEDINYYVKHLQGRPYSYGTHHLPHDAKAKRLGQKRTIEQQVRKLTSAHVVVVPRIPKKANAINAARILFPSCWFDSELCADGLNHLRHYVYDVVDGQLSEEPRHDEHSNGADAFMTLAQSIKGPRDRKGDVIAALQKKVNEFVDSAPGLGWMR